METSSIVRYETDRDPVGSDREDTFAVELQAPFSAAIGFPPNLNDFLS